MTARPTSPGAIADRMLSAAPLRQFVLVSEGVDPYEVAADIQTALAARHATACWLHARDTLERVERFALDHDDHPLVVTTASRDWSVFGLDRAWANRQGSIVFVLAAGHSQHVPAQVSTLLRPGFLVRRNPLFANRDAARQVAMKVRDAMCVLVGDPISVMKIVTKDAGILGERINWGGSALEVADRVIDESLKYDRLEVLLQRIETLYPSPEVRELLRDVRKLTLQHDG